MTATRVAGVLSVLAVTTVVATQPAGEAISKEAIGRTLAALNHDRTSGKDGERRAAALLERRLTEYGVAHRRHDIRAFMSWPVRAEVVVPGVARLSAIAPAFGGSTRADGISAEVLVLAGGATPGPSARGRLVVVDGMVSPESVLGVQRAGAAGLIHVNATDVLHEMIATTIWGTPTTASAERLPAIPVASIGRTDGDRLKGAVSRDPSLRVQLVTEVERGWTTIPLVVAEVPGRTADFVLVATHLDAWYEGMTDTAGTVASILEMARVLQTQQVSLERGVRFAWWPGHSFGRYAGSAWYADRFWEDLDRHCVAYTNLDGAGRRGSRLDVVMAGGWPGLGEYSREFAARLTGKSPPPAPARFRPGRDSDSSFQGLGIPEFSIGVPGPPRDHPDVSAGGVIVYWHTAQDTIDKIDLDALALDTRYRVAQIYDLATAAVLPHRIQPIAEAYRRAIDELQPAAGSVFDLGPVREAAERLDSAAGRLDAEPRPSDRSGIASLNRLLVRVTHRLNSMLYTRAGRFDQDPAAPVPLLPLLGDVTRLATLGREMDEFGFLETELVRGRNAVRAALVEATEEIEHYLANGYTSPRRPEAGGHLDGYSDRTRASAP
jgi:Iap family predicted aminopeptidase